jgi:hypothetical protein
LGLLVGWKLGGFCADYPAVDRSVPLGRAGL